MRENFPLLTDRPENPAIIGGVLSSLLLYFSLPFILVLATAGAPNNWGLLTTLETIYHAIGFCVGGGLFFGWLKNSGFNFRIMPKKTLQVCFRGFCLILVCYMIVHIISTVTQHEYALLALNQALPVTDTESHMTMPILLMKNTPLGILCAVVLMPLTVSCLFYSVGFAPVCYRHPWMGYVTVSAYILVLRMFVAVTYWNFELELELFLCQLPAHLIACWTYQKSDTVWAPVITLSAVNAVSCILIMLQL